MSSLVNLDKKITSLCWVIWSAEWKYSSVFQPPWLKYIQPGQRAVEAACHVSWKWHVHDDVVGDNIEQSRTLRSSYFVDTFLIKMRRFVRPIRMPRGPVVYLWNRWEIRITNFILIEHRRKHIRLKSRLWALTTSNRTQARQWQKENEIGLLNF